MYSVDWTRALGRDQAPRVGWNRVSPVVWCLGFTSMLTDISSEMVSSVLPMYLVLHLGISPLAFGAVDGLYQGASALLRVVAGYAGYRWRHHKAVAAVGYALSAVCKLGILAAGNAWLAIATLVALDRTGKGIRTAPRDALITLNSTPRDLATSFGVHRSLDAAGAMLGPLVAVGLLAALPQRFDVIFLASFAFAILGLAVLLLFVGSPSIAPGVALGPAIPPSAVVGLLREPGFRALFIAASALGLAAVSDAFVFLVLQQRVGLQGASFPLLYVGVSLVNFLFSVPGGRLADRTGRLRFFLGGQVMLLAVYAVLMLPTLGVAHVVLCVLLLGAYYAATDGVLAAVAGAALPPQLRGSGLALLGTATNGARLVASVFFGAMWTWHGPRAAVFTFGAMMVLALVASVILFRRGGLSATDHHATL
jgi:MFS family permease